MSPPVPVLVALLRLVRPPAAFAAPFALPRAFADGGAASLPFFFLSAMTASLRPERVRATRAPACAPGCGGAGRGCRQLGAGLSAGSALGAGRRPAWHMGRERRNLCGHIGPARASGDVEVGGSTPGVAAGSLLATMRKNEKGDLFDGGEEGTNHGADVLPTRRIANGGTCERWCTRIMSCGSKHVT